MRSASGATRLFDALIFALVLFPLLTGGVWIDRPGLHLELSELGIPVLIATIATLLLRRKIVPGKSAVIGLSRQAWDLWTRNGLRSVVIGSVFFGAVFSLASLRRHWALGTNALDLGIFQGALWNFVHGHGLVSPVKGGMILYRDHLYASLVAIAPLFALAPRPETLLIIQGFGIALGALPLYFVARQHVGPKHWIALACPLIYWLYLPTRNGNAYDFHPENLMLSTGLWWIACVQSERTLARWAAIPVGLLLLAGKESAGPVITGIGFAWALGAAPPKSREFCRRVGYALVPFGILAFWFGTRWIPPHVFGETYAYDTAYSGFGPGLSGILLAPFQHPLVFAERLVGPARLKFAFWTLGGLAFLPLLNWRAAIAAVPCYLMIFLTAGDHRVSLFYYYASEASIALFWALPSGWLQAGRRTGARLLLAWVLFWSLGLSGRSEAYRIRKYSPDAHAVWVRNELVPCVTADASVASTGSLMPQLAQRSWSVALPMIADCIIVDSSLDPYPLTPQTHQELVNRLMSQGFRPDYQCGSVQVLSQKSRCLDCTPTCN
jgi:uncharacterized membrane protein